MELETLKSGMGFLMDRGNMVLFWHYAWCSAIPLNQAFPEIYPLALLKHGSVEEHVKWEPESKS